MALFIPGFRRRKESGHRKALPVWIARVLDKPEVRDRHLTIHVETVASSPEEFAVTMRKDIERSGEVIRDAGIRVN